MKNRIKTLILGGGQGKRLRRLQYDFLKVVVALGDVVPHLKNILCENGKLMVFRSKNFDESEVPKDMKIYKEYSYELPFGFGKRVLSLLEFI